MGHVGILADGCEPLWNCMDKHITAGVGRANKMLCIYRTSLYGGNSGGQIELQKIEINHTYGEIAHT